MLFNVFFLTILLKIKKKELLKSKRSITKREIFFQTFLFVESLSPPDLPPFSPSMKRILAISNQKGGVGKTTTAVNLSGALAEQNQKVLLIDLDPQGNASSALGHHKQKIRYGVSDVLLGHLPIVAVSIPISSNLHLAPATRGLLHLHKDILNEAEPYVLLRNALSLEQLEYDYIIIDCPPTLSALTTNALCAASEVLIPLQTDFFALEGLNDLLNTIHSIQSKLNPSVFISGIIMTMVSHTALCREIISQVQHFFNSDVLFQTIVPRNTKLREAPSHGKSIQSYAPNSSGAIAYRQIASELLFRHGKISAPSFENKHRWKNQN